MIQTTRLLIVGPIYQEWIQRSIMIICDSHRSQTAFVKKLNGIGYTLSEYSTCSKEKYCILKLLIQFVCVTVQNIFLSMGCNKKNV